MVPTKSQYSKFRGVKKSNLPQRTLANLSLTLTLSLTLFLSLSLFYYRNVILLLSSRDASGFVNGRNSR